jgi:hypothetical protein
MLTAKKVRLMLLLPAVIAIALLSGCLDKTQKNDASKTPDSTQNLS